MSPCVSSQPVKDSPARSRGKDTRKGANALPSLSLSPSPFYVPPPTHGPRSRLYICDAMASGAASLPPSSFLMPVPSLPYGLGQIWTADVCGRALQRGLSHPIHPLRAQTCRRYHHSPFGCENAIFSQPLMRAQRERTSILKRPRCPRPEDFNNGLVAMGVRALHARSFLTSSRHYAWK